MDNSQNSAAEEFADVPVPLDKRYGVWSMGLLWVTMVTGFPAVIIGFEWSKAGYSLPQVMAGATISSVLLVGYAIAAGYTGAKSGLSFPTLCRRIFGVGFSRIISLGQSFLFFLWYSVLAVFVASELNELVLPNFPIPFMAGIAALLMALNNVFGFKGVANFARYLAAPLLILWVLAIFGKSATALSFAQAMAPAHTGFLESLSGISAFILGYAIWGNEADIWRYGKPRLVSTAVPLIVSVILGEMISPVAGWMVAHLVPPASALVPAAATTSYSFGTQSALAAVVLTVAYFATADSNMYGGINAVENVVRVPRRKLMLFLVVITAAASIVLSSCANAFEFMANLNSVMLPCVSLIIATEYWIIRRGNFTESGADAQLRTPGIIALISGWIVGVLTSGTVPSLSCLHFGIWPLYSWIASISLYYALRKRSGYLSINRP